ncbi:sensor histidine kinase [Anaeromyxobacter paludicola]|uniref:histidine kinase n=1 Tax=Anaeromyxobacter paludicola TaxID=2918171 RepID=A0ABM7XDW6_9BACT|nr:HAMP domain-containing sensor histidine kinase [Anaeromyxobacter paludicola]BDG10047.1 hypothetical protein AMPC_31600 [Anaeromyxobacter paludicola]
MPPPRPSLSEPELHAVAEVLGDPDETVLRLVRSRFVWLVIWPMWFAVLGCFVAGGYPVGRCLAFAGALICQAPLAILASRPGPCGETRCELASALLWTSTLQNIFIAGVTGGLHSPIALVLFMNFTSLYSRYGGSRAGRAALTLSCGAVLGLALLPRAWLGPVLAEPWFTVAATLAALGTLTIHSHFVGALRRTAASAVHEALRARDALAEQALARARELELVGSKLSHELKNPLTAIKALVQIAHRSARDPLLEKQLGVVEQEAERMAGILQSHLRFARPLEQLAPVDVELAELADSALALLEGRARSAGVALYRSGRARATVDPQRLRGALVNLVANAMDVSPRGGRVEVRVSEEAGAVALAVVDGGPGMAPEVLERVGTPFFTTREQGTGLGVVLARSAFEQHGGTLEYRSVPGSGTTALGTIPRPRAG